MCSDDETLQRVLPKRNRVLGALLDQPMDKRELVERLNIPRSTIDRSIRELERTELVARPSNAYRPTLYGKLAYEVYHGYLDQLCAIHDASGLLAPLAADTPLDGVVLEGATITVAQTHELDKPVRRYLEIFDESREVCGFSPVMLGRYLEAHYDFAIADDTRSELIFPPDMISQLLSRYSEQFSELLSTNNLELYQADVPLPYGLLLASTEDRRRTAITIYSDTGVKGLISNDTKAAVDWAERTYQQFRDRATKFERE